MILSTSNTPLQPSKPTPMVARWEHMFENEQDVLVIRGWAYNPEDPSIPVNITLCSDDEVVARAVATDRRGDLLKLARGDGWAGFVLHVPAVRLRENKPRLFAGNVELSAPPPTGPVKIAPPQMVGEVTRLVIEDGLLQVEGWAADISHPSSRLEVSLEVGNETWRDFAARPQEASPLVGKGEGGRGFAFSVPWSEGSKLEQVRVRLPNGSRLDVQARRSLGWSVPSPAWPPETFVNGTLCGGVQLDRRILRGWVEDTAASIVAPIEVRITMDGELVWQGAATRIENVPTAANASAAQQRKPYGYRVLLPTLPAGQIVSTVDAVTVDGRRLPGFPLRSWAGDELIGRIEQARISADQLELSGWCVDTRNLSTPVELEARRADGALLARVTASGRPDQQILKATGNAPVGMFQMRLHLSSLDDRAGMKNGDWLPVISPVGTLRRLTSRLTAADLDALQAVTPERFAGWDAPIEWHIDRLSDNLVHGWMMSTQDREAICYADIFLDNAWLATVPATRSRQDLAKRFGTHGDHGFLVELSPSQVTQVPGLLRVQPRVGDGLECATTKHQIQVAPGIKRNVIHANNPPLSHFLLPVAQPGKRSRKVSVLILNRNGARLLERFFQSFQRHNSYANIEFIVVDHASDDDSAQVCATWQEKLDIRLLPRNGNFSFSQSNNLAAQHATGEILLLANNDARLCEDILPQVVDALDDPGIGAVSPALLDDVPDPSLELPGQPGPIQHLGVHIDLGGTRKAGIVPFETRSSREWLGLDADPIEVPSVTGAFMAVRRDEFLRLGGLSEDYFYGHEDIDFTLRMRRAGLRIVALNHLRALHLRAYSRSSMSRDYSEIRLRNRDIFDRRFGVWLRRLLANDRFEKVGFWSGRRLRIAFVVTKNDHATMAGDFFTALELARELAHSYPVDCHFIEHKGSELGEMDGMDVLIAMRDDFDPLTAKSNNPAMLRVAWIRNWADRFATRTWTRDFDLIWASSGYAQARLQQVLGRSVDLMPIATAADRFAQGRRDPALECDYCFTGNFWGLNREITQNLDPTALPYRFGLYGMGWENEPQMAPYSRGPLPYDRMPDVYASTRIVIDDANHATKQMQSVNSRVFDALAAGALVLTNGIDGTHAIFGDLLPTYNSPQELEALLHRYLGDEKLRCDTVARLREIVLESHTYKRRADQAWMSLSSASATPRIAIKIGAPNRGVLAEWGDYHFADSLRQALEPLGFRVRIDSLDEWSNPQSNGDDIVLVLRGLSSYTPLPHQISLCWIISHPDRVSLAELKSYDHVFVASELFCQQLQRDLGDRVSTLLQCTDPDRFHPGASDPAFREEVLFVGNSRNQFRRVIRDALAGGIEPAIYGNRWRGLVPDRMIRGENIPNVRLAHEYRAAGVVLNDHWDTMREYGFISNRVFDVLACGGRLVSDDVSGLDELFGAMVRVYRDPAGLSEAVQSLLDEGRANQAERDAFARQVGHEHGFAARAVEIERVIRHLLNRVMAGSSDKAVAGD
ncbi:hypothetical protein A6J80_22660 (plasmid) [Paracoccus yeei]|uniref:Glycosyltransferase n=2 Tax=Paracoccus yeei TaxID=147645 RepID=A0A1V0GZ44_9RHOB|nr:hypothetical protein A6J80_22660 [Paracoccus yeei]